jgi:hypothetical protein
MNSLQLSEAPEQSRRYTFQRKGAGLDCYRTGRDQLSGLRGGVFAEAGIRKRMGHSSARHRRAMPAIAGARRPSRRAGWYRGDHRDYWRRRAASEVRSYVRSRRTGARYTQLAVAPAYRGLNIPMALLREAHVRFVRPGGFDYTWLLFPADRAASSSLCRHLPFGSGARIVSTEYGRSRVLVRNEHGAPGTWVSGLVPKR